MWWPRPCATGGIGFREVVPFLSEVRAAFMSEIVPVKVSINFLS